MQSKVLFIYQQLIPLPSHVHDADARVGFETATEFRDEYLKAAGVDEVIRTTAKPIKWFFTFNGGLAFRF